MLRISGTGGDREQASTLRLEGRVVGPWVAELRRICAEIAAATGGSNAPLVIDLAGVSFFDADGIALCRELSSRHRVVFTNGSPFIAQQLKGVADVTR